MTENKGSQPAEVQQEGKIKVKSNRPCYNAFLMGYVVNYSIDGVRSFECFDTYKEGIDFLKVTFPKWFAKHYRSPKKENNI